MFLNHKVLQKEVYLKEFHLLKEKQKSLEIPVPHLSMVYWVPRARAELAAKAVTRNKVAMGFNSLDKNVSTPEEHCHQENLFWLL